MNNEILEAALDYAERGWSVFPVSKDKHPCTKNGFKDATTDKDIITNWFSKVYTGANVAIATGEMSGGLVVIDIDIDEEKCVNGQETLDEWCSNNGCYIDSRNAVTGRGGKHYYFTSSKKYGCGIGLMEGIDIRADGGYVVAPPSIHKNGRLYFWDDEDQDIVCVQDDSDVQFFLDEYFAKSNSNNDQKKFELPKEVTTGGRNDIIFRYASLLQSQGWSDDEIFASCKVYNNENCKPPLGEEELRRSVASALRYDKGNAVKSEKKKKEQKIEEITDEDLEMPTLSQIDEKEIQWLIPGVFPKGCITILCSDGGIGKTSIWCDTIAKLTIGEKTIFEKNGTQEDVVPFGACGGKKNVMYFSKEDPTESILRAKIRVAGADLSRVRCFGLDDEKVNKITYESEYLKKLIEKYKPDIVVFDTLQSFLPDGVDMAKRKDMRDALTPLNQLGSIFGCTFLLISHTNKSSNSGRGRMADSSDIWDIGRSAFMAGKTNDENIYYLSHEKSNYSKPIRTILFSHTNDNKIAFMGLTSKKDRDFQCDMQVTRSSPKKDEAKNFILDILNDEGKIEINQIDTRAKAAGITSSTVSEARAELISEGFIKRKSEGFGASKKWFLLLRSKNDPK